MYDCDMTNPNVITIAALKVNTVQLLLPSNPLRKSFLLAPLAVGAGGLISIGLAGAGQNVTVAGGGILNYVVGATFPTLLDDDMIGSAIQGEWYVISLNGGEQVQVVEFSYVPG